LENGIEDLETVLELNDTHLDALSVPLGYKLKILKRIKIIRQEKGMTVPESRQGTRQGQRSDDNKVETEVRDVTKNDFTELPAPNETPAKSALKAPANIPKKVEGAS